jgi:alpha-L-rhamnosidase
MNSFNHYAYGAIGDWMYRVMTGLEVDRESPGYKHILIQPQPGGGLTRARASHETQYGKVTSGWQLKDGRIELIVEVPPNTQATVRLPNAAANAVMEGGKTLAAGDGITSITRDGNLVVVEVRSGRYEFAYSWHPQL